MENPRGRVHCRETILHGDPVSFICSLNSVRVNVYAIYGFQRVYTRGVFVYSNAYCLPAPARSNYIV
jgi:hypothetical protein